MTLDTVQRDLTRKLSPETARALLQRVAESFADKRFRPHPVFSGGHAQTIAAYAWPRPYRFSAPADEERLFEVEPGSRVLAHCRWQSERTAHPTVALWHGIEGSTASVYMIATAAKAYRAGFNVVRVNYRNCGGTEHLTNTLYNGGLSGDLRAVLEELIERDGLKEILAIGFSLGGNLVLKAAAEYGERSPEQILGVVAVSPSVNLSASTELIAKRSNWIYQHDFVKRLKGRVILKDQLYPGRYDLQKLQLVRTLKDFDEHFTATEYGFTSADDYYQKSSSIHIIDQIRVPTLIIHAHDDPFIPFAPLRNEALAANPFVLLVETQQGGHVAFISARPHGDEDRFWAENRAVDFCKLVVETIQKEIGV